MSENLNPAGYDEAELAYLNSRGEVPLPSEPEGESAPAPEPEASTAVPEPAPEPADPDADDAAPEDFNGRTAKWGAYLRKKGEADAARKERDDLRGRLEQREREFAAEQARIDERFKLWQASQAQAQAPQPVAPQAPAQPPNPDEDPMAYIRYQDEQRRALEERLNTIAQTQEQRDQQTRQSQQIQQLDRAYQDDNRRAMQEMPAYPDAYNFLLNMAKQDVIIQNGGQLTEAQADEHVLLQERQLAAAAFNQKVRPAQMILQMATARGWKPPSAQQPAPQGDPVAEQARIDAAARGQQQNRTLSGTGRPGGAPAGAMTLEKFMAMSDDDARTWAEKNPAEHRRIGGGQ